ncbi:NADH-dependent flavin oxidoreductase [Metabacillus iocasae]|uniref:2,4-dienoyl-CoA reductase-like NADH-dependent reductase (Old Yellow Enzyme family) n=1 Tax=Priestia iocasae TaxID=2291674 RepID=A0ABS2QYU4_9BACI|nr:NADH-dependent flavin oxidoreductase [Metabacillus iocasae]MBM7703876.1 2,4-dienoyl-CoA reductase-like NADH-dependent reductase (Old Yellow Enzyme family) [Metabacillus iocasae]
MNSKYERLFKHFKFLNGIELKSRVMMAPMLTYASHENGEVSDVEIDFYRERADGLSAIIVGPAYVMESGKVAKKQMGIHEDKLLRGLNELSNVIEKKGARSILQLSHGGRHCVEMMKEGAKALAPSAISSVRRGKRPQQMDETDIKVVCQAFANATRRAIEARFDGVELDGANGHLLQQFTSKQANSRRDRWGGTVENRMTFPLDVIRAVTYTVKATTHKPFLIGYSLAPEEKGYQGNTIEHTLEFIDLLIQEGVDYVRLHMDDLWQQAYRHKEGEAQLVPAIVKHINNRIPIISGGNLRTPDNVVDALRTGLSLVTMGTELVLEPKWMTKVRHSEEYSIKTSMDSTPHHRHIPRELWSIMKEKEQDEWKQLE